MSRMTATVVGALLSWESYRGSIFYLGWLKAKALLRFTAAGLFYKPDLIWIGTVPNADAEPS